MSYTCQKETFIITTNPNALDIDIIHAYLTRSYWKRGVPKELVSQSIEHSLCFGLFDQKAQKTQIGFARVVTDYTDFAYLCDVFVLEPYQGQGLGIWLLDCILAYPNLQDLRTFLLATRDAHGLYQKFGFHGLDTPEKWLLKLTDRPWFQPD